MKRSPIKKISTSDYSDETTILAFMVMNDDVLKSVSNLYRTKQLQLKHISIAYKRQFKNIINFYKKYKKAPRRSIKFIHDGQKAVLKNNEELKINEQVLATISEEYYAANEGYTVNSDYIIGDLIPRFLRTRKINEISSQLSMALEKGDSQEAEKILTEYDKVQIGEKDPSLGFTSPLTLDYQLEMIRRSEIEGPKTIYTFPGAMGALIGPLKRQWLMSISGPTKSSKSYFILQMAIDAVLYQKRKVMYFCPEMSEEDMNEERVVSYVTNRASSVDLAGIHYLPEFDCIKNQTGECKDRLSLGRIPLLSKQQPSHPNALKEQIEADSEQCLHWMTCTQCRFDKSKRFIPTIYFRKQRIRSFKVSDRQNRIQRRKFESLKYQHGQNLKIKYLPKYLATIEDCFGIIDNYIEMNEWKPDIIFFDYLDILNPGRGDSQKIFNDYRDYDHMWKMASRLGQEKDALVITPDQSTKAGRSTRLLDETSTSQASMKDHHVNLKIGIGKIKEETQNNIARINVLFHRHRPFNRELEVLVTQNLTCGRAFLDSEFWFDRTSPPYNIKIPPK